MSNPIKEYLHLIHLFIIDFLDDIRSLRYQLVIWAFILNFYVLKLVEGGKADYKLAGITVGLLTIVYTLYFASRHAQAMVQNQNEENTDEEEEL